MSNRNTLLVARVNPPSEAYCAAASQFGLQVWHRSMLSLQVANLSLLLPQLVQLTKTKPAPTLVFSSPFAASVLQMHAPELLNQCPLLAVGASTAAALAPFSARFPSKSEGAQALLDMLPNSLEGQTFCLFQAPDALPILAQGLRDRGAVLQIIEAYARMREPMTREERERLQMLQCADVGSGEQLQALMDAGLPLDTALILPSQRVKDQAVEFGITSVVCCVSLSDEGVRIQYLDQLLKRSELSITP
jgi:uroporphyrinogen-III synthase